MRYVTIDGKRYEWATIRKLRREQILEARRIRQLTLFELRDDSRPKSQTTAKGRLQEPTLFEA